MKPEQQLTHSVQPPINSRPNLTQEPNIQENPLTQQHPHSQLEKANYQCNVSHDMTLDYDHYHHFQNEIRTQVDLKKSSRTFHHFNNPHTHQAYLHGHHQPTNNHSTHLTFTHDHHHHH
jgi:hypothetical protein